MNNLPSFEQLVFYRLNNEKLGTFADLKNELFIKLNSNPRNDPYTVIIGTDSQDKNRTTAFSTSIVLHKTSRGAFGYYCKFNVKKIESLNEKILTETSLSIQFAYAIIDLLDEFAHDFEIHVDANLNRKFKSSSVVSSAIGFVEAQGFKCEVKPKAWVASKVCDKKVKQ